MISSVIGSTTIGVNAFMVTIETHLEKVLPKVVIVGLPDSAIKEAAERVLAAIKNSFYHFPTQKVTVNLAPADIRKEGSGFDLPIALGILCETGQVKPDMLKDYVFAGELSLDGKLRPVKGILPITIESRKNGLLHRQNLQYSFVLH